jgi:hypothetical protein
MLNTMLEFSRFSFLSGRLSRYGKIFTANAFHGFSANCSVTGGFDFLLLLDALTLVSESDVLNCGYGRLKR